MNTREGACKAIPEVLVSAILLIPCAQSSASEPPQQSAANTQVPALILRAEALIERGRIIEAEELLKQAVKLNPDATHAHRWLAVIYYDLGADIDAEKHLLKIAELDKNDPRQYRMLGLIHKDNDDCDRAIESYQKSLEREPRQHDRDEVLTEMSECFMRLDRFGEAHKTLQDVKQSADRDALMAECLFKLGKTQDAVDLCDAILRQDPKLVRALRVRGEAHVQAEEIEKAVELFGRAAELDAFNYEARRDYARALKRAGDAATAKSEQARSDELLAQVKRLIELEKRAVEQPHDAEVRLELADLTRQLGRPDLGDMWQKAAESLEKH